MRSFSALFFLLYLTSATITPIEPKEGQSFKLIATSVSSPSAVDPDWVSTHPGNYRAEVVLAPPTNRFQFPVSFLAFGSSATVVTLKDGSLHYKSSAYSDPEFVSGKLETGSPVAFKTKADGSSDMNWNGPLLVGNADHGGLAGDWQVCNGPAGDQTVCFYLLWYMIGLFTCRADLLEELDGFGM